MNDKLTPKPGDQVDSISHDLDALRQLNSTDLRPGWLRQFATILILVSAFVLIVWFGATHNESDKPVVFNAGVVLASDSSTAPWVGPALQQAMVATIRSGEQLRFIDPVERSSSKTPLGPSATASVQSGADWVLSALLNTGEFGADTLVVNLSLTKAGESSPRYSEAILGTTNSIADLAARNADQIYVWLGVESLSREQLDYASNEIPSAVASELYGRGLAELSRGNGRKALEHLEQANTVYPNNAAIHEALSNVWEHLGYAENAARESALALAASDKLSRRRQLELEAAYARRSGDWPRAEQVFSALKEFSPQTLSYRLGIADSQVRQNDNDEFINSVEQMRALGGSVGDDPRIDLAEAEYWFQSGDYKKCFALAQTAETKTRESDDRYLLAEAIMSAARCDDSFRPERFIQARAIFDELGTRVRHPEILRGLAKHEYTKGDTNRYIEYSENAVAEAIRLGNEPEVAASRNALAIAYDLRGWLTRGYELKKQVAEYQRQRNNKSRYAIVLENIGISLFKLGRYEEAKATIDQAEVVFKEIDDTIGIAWLPYRRGQIALRQGDIGSARKLMSQALENSKERPEGGLETEASFELGLIEYYSGNYGEAKRLLDKANVYYRNGELNTSIAEAEIALARVDNARQNYSSLRSRLTEAEQLLAEETAYYMLSLRAEQLNFELDETRNERQKRCARLTEAVQEQEHREFLLRAKSKIVVCRALFNDQPYAVSHAMLVAVEEEARMMGLFEVQLTSGFIRAELLRKANRNEESALEFERTQALADSRGWRPHPWPDLAIK